jgi:hypothetical protein
MDANGRKNNQNTKPRNKTMRAEPLKKELYTKAKELGVEKIILQFSGGNDEGNLNVDLEPEWSQDFANQVEGWAWEVYSYSGAGDGSDYGDDITYDLVKNKVSTSEWYTSVERGSEDDNDIEIDED